MAFPLNPIDGQLYNHPSGQVFIFSTNYWKVKQTVVTQTPVEIAKSTDPNMTIKAGNISGKPHIQVNNKWEQVTLHSELDGSNTDSLDINAGYF